MKTYKNLMSSIAAAVIVSACGGGGDSGGEFHAPYHITLRAEKTQLPVNVNNDPVGQGVFRPYSTTLYVEATEAGRPIPNSGDDTFGCNMAGGLDSGSLYYLDGEHEIEIDDGNGGTISVPGAFRSITLAANSGGNSFHFHAGNQAGTARIVCTVLDPRDNKYHSASVDITVGYATGHPSHMRVVPEGGWNGYLGTQNNTNRIPNAQVMQVQVLDDNNQPVSSGNTPSVQVRILPNTDAAVGARLVRGQSSSSAGSGTVLQLPTIQNVASFSVISGSQTGPIFLEYTADRHDNDISNGIQDPITVIGRVDVIKEITAPVFIDETEEVIEMTNTVPFSYLLTAKDGLPPYNWTVTGLPRGLSLDASIGVINGVPNDRAGEYLVWLTVSDQNKKEAKSSIRMRIHDAITPEDFAISGCAHLANAEQTCHIATAVTGVEFSYAFTTSTRDVTWEFSRPLPTWLEERSGSSGSSGNTTGFVIGTPKCEDVGVHRFFVTATKGADATATSVTRAVAVSVIRGNGC